MKESGSSKQSFPVSNPGGWKCSSEESNMRSSISEEWWCLAESMELGTLREIRMHICYDSRKASRPRPKSRPRTYDKSTSYTSLVAVMETWWTVCLRGWDENRLTVRIFGSTSIPSSLKSGILCESETSAEYFPPVDSWVRPKPGSWRHWTSLLLWDKVTKWHAFQAGEFHVLSTINQQDVGRRHKPGGL